MARYIGIARDTSGMTMPGATVNVYEFGTTTAVTTYSDRGLTTANTSLVADSKGLYSFYVFPGEYTITVTSQSGTQLNSFEARVGLADSDWAFISSSGNKNLRIQDIDNLNNIVTLQDAADEDSLYIDADKNIGLGGDSPGSGQGGIYIKNASVNPSAGPTGGGGMYADSSTGELKWIESDGTISGAGSDSNLVGLNIYHPDKVPSSGLIAAASDEFVDGAGLSWDNTDRSGGGPNSYTYEWDVFKMNNVGIASGENIAVSAIAAPSSANDYCVVTKVSALMHDNGGNGSFGIFMITEGTLAAPTKLFLLGTFNTGTTLNVECDEGTSGWTIFGATPHKTEGVYTVGGTTGAEFSVPLPPLYLMMRWNTATPTIEFRYSWDGYNWQILTNRSGTGTPDFMGMYTWSRNGTNTNQAMFHYFRTIEDAEALTGKIGN